MKNSRVNRIAGLLLLTLLFMFPLTTWKLDGVEAKELKELQKEQKNSLNLTKEHWIGWRYYMSRLMFYTTHLVTYRCAVKEVIWGLDPKKLDKKMLLGKPDPNYGEKETIIKFRQQIFEKDPTGCDPVDPYNTQGLIIVYYVDEINEGDSDSFVGLDEKTEAITSISVQLIFFDGTKSKVETFDIPKKVLREMEANKN